ncbi:ABC transporter ATP-binding protein [Clostridium gasigenes]|uniref:ABC transporter ATP-binding protein n=1 Tax=Clostridium gasigenes TaxID=94869 RepID=A0A7X0SAZ7_9CLOT|nr:ABC transporter ATP-binding protein [Clostridium gasigenes]MBB6714320.1 ABC transporter ATP-binding protein [Clostridium gasigenes]
MGVLKVDNLTKDYGNNKGVFDVSFEIEEGEVFGFLGPNGAGKTTTIRHILGFSKPKKGNVSVLGINSWDKPEVIQKELGYLPGEITFPGDMTGTAFIKMIADMREMTNMSRAEELIEIFELDPSGDLKRMSKGMKQKIGIVCAFMHSPKILILDEPTSGLDPLMQSKFISLIASEKANGKTILMSSHIFEEVEKTCDRIAIIKKGRIIETIDSSKLKHGKQKFFKIEFESEDHCERFSKEELKFISVNIDKKQVNINVQDEEINELIQILSRYKIKYLKEVKHTLEDYFMHFYGGEGYDK